MTFSNNLNRDHAPRNVGPDLRSILFDSQLQVLLKTDCFALDTWTLRLSRFCQFNKLSKNFLKVLYWCPAFRGFTVPPLYYHFYYYYNYYYCASTSIVNKKTGHDDTTRETNAILCCSFIQRHGELHVFDLFVLAWLQKTTTYSYQRNVCLRCLRQSIQCTWIADRYYVIILAWQISISTWND